MQSSRQIRDCLPTATEVAGAKPRDIPVGQLESHWIQVLASVTIYRPGHGGGHKGPGIAPSLFF